MAACPMGPGGGGSAAVAAALAEASDEVAAPEATGQAGVEPAVALLRAAFRHLVVQEGFLDTQSSKGFLACQAFLQSIELCSDAMLLEPAARSYRDVFSRNFRGLFAGHSRSYRVDVLEAGTSLGLVVFSNGERVQLSQAIAPDAEGLRDAWISLGCFLSRWDGRSWSEKQQDERNPSALDELRTALARLDYAWAGFERVYVEELMLLQERGRHLLRKAVTYEQRLRDIEERGTRRATALESQELQALQHKLIECLEQLNLVANVRRKGCHRLSATTLLAARRVLALRRGGCPARVLGERVLQSYAQMREYLREVGTRLEEVDPDLWRNADLVDQLEHWEENWEIGARYLQEPRQFHAVCDMVAYLREVLKVAPDLARMCEDRDPELFLALPRAVLLAFLAAPRGPRAALLRRLLPHKFTAREGAAEDAARSGPGPELLELAGRVGAVQLLLERSAPSRVEALRVLLLRVTVGPGCDASAAEEALEVGAREALDSFVRELEGLSMELQRASAGGRTPEDWNECAEVLVQCLLSTAGAAADPPE